MKRKREKKREKREDEGNCDDISLHFDSFTSAVSPPYNRLNCSFVENMCMFMYVRSCMSGRLGKGNSMDGSYRLFYIVCPCRKHLRCLCLIYELKCKSMHGWIHILHRVTFFYGPIHDYSIVNLMDGINDVLSPAWHERLLSFLSRDLNNYSKWEKRLWIAA